MSKMKNMWLLPLSEIAIFFLKTQFHFIEKIEFTILRVVLPSTWDVH
jgi:hypothetical protein